MRKDQNALHFIPLYLFCPIALIVLALLIDNTVTVFYHKQNNKTNLIYVIDAGHGGMDGGATSLSGILESNINLEVARRLNDIMHLLGLNTYMIRTEDISVHTEGNTIAEQKRSDLNQRIHVINSFQNAVLLSLHQNYFTSPQYSGAQVFYARKNGSKFFAENMQNTFKNFFKTNRNIKKSDGIYIMEQVNCPAILIECGFISNPAEEKLLLSANYQRKLCAVIASVCSQYPAQNYNLA